MIAMNAVTVRLMPEPRRSLGRKEFFADKTMNMFGATLRVWDYSIQAWSSFSRRPEWWTTYRNARVPGDGPLSVQDPGNAVGRHVKFAGQLGGAHAEFLKFCGR